MMGPETADNGGGVGCGPLPGYMLDIATPLRHEFASDAERVIRSLRHLRLWTLVQTSSQLAACVSNLLARHSGVIAGRQPPNNTLELRDGFVEF